jgi:hypothetical protein
VVPLESAKENFFINFPGTQFQAQQESMNLVLMDEKLDKIGATLENTP